MENKIGEQIHEIRRKKKISQRKLSKLTGAAQDYICKVERGNASPSYEFVEKILKALGAELIIKED
jgi:transcriptional regulator with XRE-family HTH domain